MTTWLAPRLRDLAPAPAIAAIDKALQLLERALQTPDPFVRLRYTASVTPDASRAAGGRRFFRLQVTDANALTINRPIGGADGALITINVVNGAGGAMGVITWAAEYLFLTPWVNPAAGQHANATFVKLGSAADGSWIQVANEPDQNTGGGGGGEANTASNVGSAGIGVWDAKVGVDLQFRKLNSLSSAVSIALDAANKKIDLDLVNAQIALAKLADMTGPAVLGRAAASSGVMAAISAGADDRVLARLAGSLSFGQLTVGMAPANLWTFAKIVQMANQRVAGRNTAGTGDIEEVTATQLLDWIGATRGSVLYRGAAGWAALTPGTSGFFLQSQGAGADPVYASAAGGSEFWSRVRRTSDNTINNGNTGATLTSDSVLQIALAAGTAYRIRACFLLDTANATMDYKYAWNYSGTWTGIRWASSDQVAGGAAYVARGGIGSLQGSTSVTGTTSGQAIIESDIWGQTNTAGTLAIQFAQNTADAGNLRIQSGSYIEYAAW